MRLQFGFSLGKTMFVLVALFAMTTLCTAGDGYKSLFNGKDIDGWIKRGGDATYYVEDGCIVGQRGDGPNTFLCTPDEYGNFILYFECKFDEPINSGVQFRSSARPNGDREVVYGYQCELDQNSGNSGRVYDESRRGRWISNLDTEVTKDAFVADDWNTLVIQAIGPCIKIWVNDVVCSDFADVADLKGFFGLQVHGSSEPTGKVRWRNIWVKELPPTEWQKLLKPDFEDIWVSPAGKWEIDDQLVAKGTAERGESRDGMLKYEEILKDHAARVTFKQVNGNSGLYFRAVEVDKPYWLRGFQDEIDRAATASLWEVEGRGWVARNNELAEKVFKEGDWNTVSIVAVGDRLITELNGQIIIDIVDPECLKEGKVALQLHGGSDMEYYFKDFDILVYDDEQRAMIENDEMPEPDFSEATPAPEARRFVPARRPLQRLRSLIEGAREPRGRRLVR
ncbi:MAG: DUF1080 domain-containing protein [Planctomycetaceae bacterium]|nr:DUF1080 domain-containing protein [Planctomycetaceae bacterium]